MRNSTSLRLSTVKNEDDLLKRALWWQNMYNLHRPHGEKGDLTPYEKLTSLGYATPEAICLLPPLILDSVCCLKPFQVKVKGVQDHLDHYLILRKSKIQTKKFARNWGLFHQSPRTSIGCVWGIACESEAPI